MIPGPAAVCFGTVMHHRLRPTDHRFSYRTNQVWLDPDDPEELTDRNRLWSTRWPAPVRIRRRDYFDGGTDPIGPALRRLAEPVIGAPVGAIRMLTQPRAWGWLFNPITIYLLWPADGDHPPNGAVLEVTNTPWKERHHYVLPLAARPAGPEAPTVLDARFAKALHVSPFLDEHHDYHFRLFEADRPDGATRTTIEIDVGAPSTDSVADRDEAGIRPPTADGVPTNPTDCPVLRTRLTVDRHPATPSLMTHYLLHNPAPTHRVSLGIHAEAFRLWRRRVPVVRHPRRRAPGSPPRQEIAR